MKKTKKRHDTSPRADKSLKRVTQQIVAYLKQHKIVKMKDLVQFTCKRRCYDVVLVLEAVGLLTRVERNTVAWLTPDDIDDAAISETFWEDLNY